MGTAGATAAEGMDGGHDGTKVTHVRAASAVAQVLIETHTQLVGGGFGRPEQAGIIVKGCVAGEIGNLDTRTQGNSTADQCPLYSQTGGGHSFISLATDAAL